MLSFKIGDKAVYPAHGVGQVTAIEDKEIGGETLQFYILKILSNNMTIMVPSENAERIGLRQVVGKKEIRKVMITLRKRDVEIDHQTWNRRYREYMEKIKTGSVLEIAEVIRDLYLLKENKELSFGERKMLDMARGLLVKELSIARKKEEHEIELELDKIFSC